MSVGRGGWWGREARDRRDVVLLKSAVEGVEVVGQGVGFSSGGRAGRGGASPPNTEEEEEEDESNYSQKLIILFSWTTDTQTGIN